GVNAHRLNQRQGGAVELPARHFVGCEPDEPATVSFVEQREHWVLARPPRSIVIGSRRYGVMYIGWLRNQIAEIEILPVEECNRQIVTSVACGRKQRLQGISPGW